MKRAIVVIALAAAPVFADEVYLRGGGKFSGEIVEQTDEFVTVDIGGGVLKAPMASVVSIEKGVSPLQEYRARAAAIPSGDAEGWRELARWAQKQALSSQAWDAWSEVISILPNDEEANRALGHVLLDGRWVTEEESYRARGYVQFEGQWMTPAEKQEILDDRRARKKAERQENQSQIRAIQAEIDAEKRREDAEYEARRTRYDRLPEYRGPTPMGWGSGVVYWPPPANAARGQELAGSLEGTP